MRLPISKRLLACADFVRPGDTVADIGCDHGYLGIHLLSTGIVKRVIASDIKQGPLDCAIRNAQKYTVADKMSFHLSNGACQIPRDFDVMVCAGMGADTVISILTDAPWLKSDRYRLILQCQSKTPALRRFLSENGWYLCRERVLRDGQFLYTVMEVLYQPDAPRLSVGQWYFPPALREDDSPERAEYCRRAIKNLRLSVEGHGAHADPAEVAALAELTEEDSHDNR